MLKLNMSKKVRKGFLEELRQDFFSEGPVKYSMIIECGFEITEELPDSNLDRILSCRVISIDEPLRKLLGAPQDYAGKPLKEFFNENTQIRSALNSFILNKFVPVAFEYKIPSKKKSRSLQVSVSGERKGKILTRIVISYSEIISKRTSINSVARELFKNIFYGNPAATVLIDSEGSILDLNPQFTNLFGYELSEIKGKDINELLVPKDRIEEGRRLDIVALKEGYINFEGERLRKDGSKVQVLISGSPLIYRGREIGVIGTYFDISEIKKAHEKITFYATHDTLTGLPNRHLLTDRFSVARARAKRNNSKIGVFFIDVNRFKDINDTYGHNIGDIILTEIAARLSSIFRYSDTVVRFGGDEFIIIAEDIQSMEDLVSVAVKIMGITNEPFKINSTKINVNLNVGISVFPDDGEELVELIRKGDLAMYSAKAKGDNNFELFSKNIEQARLRTITELKMRELQFKLAFEKSPFAACILDSNFNIFRINENFKKLFKHTSYEVIYKPIVEFFPYEARNKLETALSKAREENEASFIFKIGKDDKDLTLNVTIGSFPALKEKAKFYILNFIDITRNQIYLEQIESSEKMLITIIENSPFPMFVINKEHKVTHFNSALEKLSGVKRNKVIGQNYMKIVHPYEKRPSLADMVVDMLPREAILKMYPYRFRKMPSKGGIYVMEGFHTKFADFADRDKICDVYVSPIFEENGEIKGAIEIIEDKTYKYNFDLLQEASMRIVRSVLSSKGIKAFLNDVHRVVNSIVTTENLFIALRDENDAMRFIYFKDKFDKNPKRVPLRNSLSGYLFKSGKPLLANKLQIKKLAKEKSFLIRGHLPESFIAVPLKNKNITFGILVTQSYDPEILYSKNDLKNLTFIANEITVGILKKQGEEALNKLLREEKREKEEARIFADVINSLEGIEDFTELMEGILNKLKEVIPYETANIALLENNHLRNAVSIGYEKYGIEEYVKNLVQDVSTFKETQKAIRTKKPVIINNTEKCKSWIVIKETKWIKSHLVVPILVNGQCMGLLRIDSSKINAFSREDAKRIIPFRSAVSIALGKISRVKELSGEINKKMDLLQKIKLNLALHDFLLETSSNLLNKKKNRNKVITDTLKSLKDLFEADHVFLFLFSDDKEYISESFNVYDEDLHFPEDRHSNVKLTPLLRDVSRCASEKNMLVLNGSHPKEYDKIYHHFKLMGINAIDIVCVGKEEVLGILGVSYVKRKPKEDEEYTGTLNLLGTLITNSILLDRAMQEKEKYMKELEDAIDASIMTIVKILELRDPYTAGHGKRVSEIATQIAENLGMASNKIETIRVAGLLHDIGKIFVPSEILSKPTLLNTSEYNLVKAHPSAGYEILRTIKHFEKVAEITLVHHERLDGSGYPKSLKGNEIPLEARIIAVADVYEAMTSHRPYRPAHTKEEAVAELINNKGILYDPAVVEAFLSLQKLNKIPEK